jgi:hypothetical protein
MESVTNKAAAKLELLFNLILDAKMHLKIGHVNGT